MAKQNGKDEHYERAAKLMGRVIDDGNNNPGKVYYVLPALIKTPIMNQPAPIRYGACASAEMSSGETFVRYVCTYDIDCAKTFDTVEALRPHISMHTRRAKSQATLEAARAKIVTEVETPAPTPVIGEVSVSIKATRKTTESNPLAYQLGELQRNIEWMKAELEATAVNVGDMIQNLPELDVPSDYDELKKKADLYDQIRGLTS